MAELHIVGAGLAGLAAAVEASATGRWDRVRLYEATARAGGRCRSFYDEKLGCVIDNGNHLLLGANRAALAYLEATGGRSALATVAPAAIPFLDLKTGETWVLRPNAGPVPWWLLSSRRGVPDLGFGRRVRMIRLVAAMRSGTVAEAAGPACDPLYRRLWEPLATAILNTSPAEASARLLRRVLLALGAAGEAGMRPYFAAAGLSAAFVDPALSLLRRRGVAVAFGWRLRKLETSEERVVGLDFGRSAIPLGRDDAVAFALPAHAALEAAPGLCGPVEARPIVNLHFRLAAPVRLPGGYPFLGLVGGTAQWLFARGELVSVTVSAAGPLVELDHDAIVAQIWSEVARVIGARGQPPPVRVIKERRATIAQTPAALARRPGAATRFRNLALAGDWVETGLPATIEGAIRSGRQAVRLLARR